MFCRCGTGRLQHGRGKVGGKRSWSLQLENGMKCIRRRSEPEMVVHRGLVASGYLY